MANNYCQFSIMYYPPINRNINTMRDLTEDNSLKIEIEKEIDRQEEEDVGYFDWKIESKGIWIYTEESGSPEAAITMIQYLQKHYNDYTPFIITWATWCSKPRLNEFGGGGAVVLPDNIHFVDTYNWCKMFIKSEDFL